RHSPARASDPQRRRAPDLSAASRQRCRYGKCGSAARRHWRSRRRGRPKDPRQGTAKRSFDHLVGAGKDRRRHSETERLGGLPIADKLDPRRLRDREIGWLGATEDLPREDPGLSKSSDAIDAIANQAARRWEVFPHVDRWNGMA